MKLKKIVFILACACAISMSAQASKADKGAGWSKICESWVGADINELIGKWGPPSSEYRMPNRNVIYTWQRKRSYTEPVQVYPDGLGGYSTDGGYQMTFVCNTHITADPNGIIFDWKWDGNNC